MAETSIRKPGGRGAVWTASACLVVVAGMTGLAFASAPLYALFCKATGFDGTPRIGAAPIAGSAESTGINAPVTVHFDTNVGGKLPWRFQAETRSVSTPLGQTATVFFKVTNTGPTASTGMAVFNVQPNLVGSYFVKVQCFCFDEHTLQPGETMEFPLVFYVDPALRKDADISDLAEMTLSYTYYPSKNGSPSTALAEPQGKSGAKTTF